MMFEFSWFMIFDTDLRSVGVMYRWWGRKERVTKPGGGEKTEEEEER